MIKRTIKETIDEYDNEGKMIRKTVTETKEEDNNPNLFQYTTTPCIVPEHLNTNDSIINSPIITCREKQV